MATTSALPDVGMAVPLPAALDLSVLDELSVGQLSYVVLAATTTMAQRMADPATAHEFAQYGREAGADWSGHQPVEGQESTEAERGDDQIRDESAPTLPDGSPVIAPRPKPTAPECLWDTVPVIADMLRRTQYAQDAMVTGFARHLQPVFDQQPEYLGTPEGVNAFKDSNAYFKEVLCFSAKTTQKIHARLPYVTWNPGQDPTLGVNQPTLEKLATAFHEGSISAENLDRIVWLDQDLTKYVRSTKARPEDKDAVLRHFEPTLVEAAESSNPDAFNAARRRWAEKMAHSLDADGPPIAQTLRKKPDNIIRDQAYADGSGRVSAHLTPEIFAEYKNFVVNQLNRNGTPLKPDPSLIEWLYTPADDEQDTPDTSQERPEDAEPVPDRSASHSTNEQNSASHDDPHHRDPRISDMFDDMEADYPLNTASLDDLSLERDPEAITATDDQEQPVTQQELDEIETLSPGQMFSAILIGMFKAICTMNPEELRLKKSHGAASTLVIVQDIETAYRTLGIGAIPEEARRPRGPHGVVPTVIKRPNPDDPTARSCDDPEHEHGHSPPWTGYISEALNVGAMHPQNAQPLACDSALVGQIWQDHHSVLNQRRAQRIFTPAQRRAILARDRGCQAPGCTINAALCQIHHITPWELGGPSNVDNAITLCAHHHGAVHNTKWTIRTLGDTHYFQPAAWLDPAQPLLRNMYWAL